MITEDYVSFEIAKLLKERGFEDDFCHTAYDCNGEFFWYGDYSKDRKGIMDAPTLQMAMKWLREVHNIGISVVPHSYKEGKPFDYEFEYWNGEEYHTPYNEKHPTYHELFGKTWKKYEEACEAAIKYCLENLI